MQCCQKPTMYLASSATTEKNNLRIMVYTMEKQKRMNLEFIKQQSNCHVWYDCWHMQTNQKIKNKINFDLNGVQNNY